jgi:hypothetical protein
MWERADIELYWITLPTRIFFIIRNLSKISFFTLHFCKKICTITQLG